MALRRTRRGSLALYVCSVAWSRAYYLSGRVGLELAYLDGAVAALWPPAGFGLAVLFWGRAAVAGRGDRRSVACGLLDAVGTVVAQTVGNTLALVVAALLLRRLTGGRGELSASLTWWPWSFARCLQR